jgi:hypothetical protein
LLAWGIGLAVHAFTVFGPSRIRGQDWEDRKIRERMSGTVAALDQCIGVIARLRAMVVA